MRKKILGLLFIPFLLFLFLFPRECFQASCEGVSLWWNTVLPSLLPFMILSNLLIQTNLIETFLNKFEKISHICLGTSSYGAYTLILGLLCGFPMGAKLTADFYASGRIGKEEADYLLMISNHASPMFIINYLVMQTFNNSDLRLPVLGILYCSALISVVIWRIQRKRFRVTSNIPIKKEMSVTGSTGAILDTSIMNSFDTITRLGGYIITFSIYGALLQKVLVSFPTLQAVLAGVTEITTGALCIHKSSLSQNMKFLTILCCTSFGGLSTVAQTSCVIQNTGLSIKTYLKGKILNAAVTSILVLFVLTF